MFRSERRKRLLWVKLLEWRQRNRLSLLYSYIYTVNLIQVTFEIIHQFTAYYGIVLIISIDLQLHQC